MYEQNVRLEQEYYGSIQLGAFPTRGWGVADYPYGSSVGLSDPWGASGSDMVCYRTQFDTPVL